MRINRPTNKMMHKAYNLYVINATKYIYDKPGEMSRLYTRNISRTWNEI
jgi:hypothetical protein